MNRLMQASAALIACAWMTGLANAQQPLVLPPAPAGVQTSVQYGIEFATIGSPGNAPFRDADHRDNPNFFGDSFDGRGSIGYEYRMSRTEITVGQWLPFVQAFAPYWNGAPNDLRMTGANIGPAEGGTYAADPRRLNDPAALISWTVAAAYCNWLHNGRQSSEAAFRTGAYNLTGIDLSGATPFVGTIQREPGALFGLPTFDEWHKAMYFDPNRHGAGQPGWWIYPASTDSPLVGQLPENGGTTNAGAPFFAQRPYPVAEYIMSQSPWGLFDGSGGVREFTSDLEQDLMTGIPVAWTAGTGFGSDLIEFFDLPGLNAGGRGLFTGGSVGIRLWAAIPTTETAAALLVAGFTLLSRKRR